MDLQYYTQRKQALNLIGITFRFSHGFTLIPVRNGEFRGSCLRAEREGYTSNVFKVMTINETPPLDLLERASLPDNEVKRPLHSQVRHILRDLIDNHFDDGQQFWTEGVLIERLGVSRITVRRALEDLTREGVLLRHRAKGSFVCKGATETQTQSGPLRIGVFVPRVNSPLLAALLEQVGLIGAEKRQQLSIYVIEHGQSIESMLAQLDGDAQSLGLLLMGSPYSVAQELHDALAELNYRVVCIDTPARNAAFVGIDNAEGIRLGVEHLRNLGHSHVAFIVNEPSIHPNANDRTHYFKRYCQENGIEPLVLDPGPEAWGNSYTATYYVIQQALDAGVTAIFTISDSGAWSALKWLRERGIDVPRDISVLGFDDEAPSRHTYPTLSSIAIPPADIARHALELLNSPDLKSTFFPPVQLIKPHLMVRESTGPSPR